jgi:hypothetical protein
MKSASHFSTWLCSGFHLIFVGVLSIRFAQGPTQGAPSQAPDVELPPAALAALEKQAAALAVVHLEYSEAKAGAVSQVYGRPTSYTADFDQNRFYQRREDANRNRGGLVDRLIHGRFERAVHEDAFSDGVCYSGEPRRGGGEFPAALAKYALDDRTDPDRSARFFDFPYLDAAGFYTPCSIADLEGFIALRPLVLHYLRESEATTIQSTNEMLLVTVQVPDRVLMSARDVDLENRRKMLQSGKNSPDAVNQEIENLRRMQGATPKRIITFILDPAHGYAPVEREERTPAGQRIVRIRSGSWKQYASSGIWLPGQCVAWYYTNPFALTDFSDEPRLTVSLDLNRIEFRPKKPCLSVLDYKTPGTLIVDRSSPEARQAPNHQVLYTAPADGQSLRRMGEGVVQELNRTRFFTWMAANSVIMGIVVMALWIRRKNRCRGT